MAKLSVCELHLHDHYSVLDGLNTPAEYMKRASELGMTALAQTNHGTLSGWRDFQREAGKAGIKPILGVEAYISATDRFDRRATSKREDGTQAYNHIGLLAVNETGIRNISTMMGTAWGEGFYGKPRIDMELLEEYQDGVIVLSGCMNGLMSRSLEQGNYDKALRTAKHLKGIFDDRFFIEIQGHNPPELNEGLLKLANDTNALPVVTSDCHYARKEDLWVEEAMLILSTNPQFDRAAIADLDGAQKMDYVERFNYLYPNRTMTFAEIEIYLRSAHEQHELLAAQGIGDEPIENTLVVADMVEEYPYHKGLDVLPSVSVNVTDQDAELRKLAHQGLRERFSDPSQEYIDRLDHELEVIKNKGFASYFLILADVVRWCGEEGIFIGPGRGSGISSLVNYSLKITNIDPIPYKLLFFRFLDPDRDDWPDVDIDIEVKRRYEVKSYVNKKYGHTANIMTFGYFKAKSAIRSAAQALKIPAGETMRAVKPLTDDEPEVVFEDFLTNNNENLVKFREAYPEVLPLARELVGRIRSVGMHAGGTVISKVPITDYVPMQTAKDPNDEAGDRVPVIGMDMTDAADIGFIKYDFLGLNNLTVILETIESIDKDINPYDITMDDPEVFKMLERGHTKGVFQCEGGPYTSLLMNMGGVNDFEDLISSNALVRPGAADSSVGKNYVRGKETGWVEYIHPNTKAFTSETYGTILFQEQQMLLCTEVAGMTMREANQVRQAISKKKSEALAKWKPAFIKGMTNAVGEKKAVEVWEDLEKSAKYAFNRAHSVGYSMISYWTAWFKLYYPKEYMCALLNNISGTDKKEKALDYLMEARRLGIKIKIPHINYSGTKSKIEDDGIRLGLETIKYISGKVGAKIIEHRPYASYSDFYAKASAKGSGINSRAVSALNLIGAATFDDNPKRGNERDNYYEYLNIPAFNSEMLDPKIVEQFRSLDEYTENESFVVMGMVRKIKYGTGWALVDLLDDTASVGVFTDPGTPIETGKLYVLLISDNRIARYITTDELVQGEGGVFNKWLNKESLALSDDEMVCISYKTRTTKTKSKMANVVLSDKDKNLVGAAVFSKSLDSMAMALASGTKIKPVLKEGNRGGYILEGIN